MLFRARDTSSRTFRQKRQTRVTKNGPTSWRATLRRSREMVPIYGRQRLRGTAALQVRPIDCFPPTDGHCQPTSWRATLRRSRELVPIYGWRGAASAFRSASTSGSRTSAHFPLISIAFTFLPSLAAARIASVSSYSPLGDFSKRAT